MTQVYKKGAVSVQPGEAQLPQGEAKRLNEQAGTPEAKAAVNGPQTPSPDVLGAPGAVMPGQSGPVKPQGRLSDEEAMLAGPTDRPNEPVSTPATSNTRVPDRIMEAIPGLLEAAKDPNAPPALMAFVRLLDHEING